MGSYYRFAFNLSLKFPRALGSKTTAFFAPLELRCSQLGTLYPFQTHPRPKLIFCKVPLAGKASNADDRDDKIPVQLRIPLLSAIYDLITRSAPTVHAGRRYGDIYKTSILGFTMTVITDRDEIINAYKDSNLYSIETSILPLTQLFGESCLLAMDGAEHMQKKSVVQPAFSPQMFSLYFDNVSLAANQLWDHVSKELEASRSITLTDLLKQHYLRLIICITTGKKLSNDLSSDPSIGPMSVDFVKLAKGLFGPQWTPSLNAAVNSRDKLLNIFKSLIRERIDSCAEMISELREAGNNLAAVAKRNLKSGKVDILTVAIASSALPLNSTENLLDADLEDLGNSMLFIWFAGYTTQGTTSMSAIMKMHFEDDVKNRLFAEQEALVSSTGSRTITFEQVTQQMPLLDSFISEVLRMYPAAPLLFRTLLSDTKLSGYNVKKGSLLGLDIHSAQRDAKYYECPEKFAVDRFLSSKKPQPHEVLSFGASGGAHFCLGAALARVNMKVTLSTLLRNFDIQLDPLQTQKYVYVPEVQPASGVKVVSCKRKQV